MWTYWHTSCFVYSLSPMICFNFLWWFSMHFNMLLYLFVLLHSVVSSIYVLFIVLWPYSKKLLCFNWLMLQEAHAYAGENGLFFIETSAKTSVNVNDIFYEIGAIVIWLFPYGHYIIAWFLFIKFCSLYFILLWFFNLLSILTRWE